MCELNIFDLIPADPLPLDDGAGLGAAHLLGQGLTVCGWDHLLGRGVGLKKNGVHTSSLDYM